MHIIININLYLYQIKKSIFELSERIFLYGSFAFSLIHLLIFIKNVSPVGSGQKIALIYCLLITKLF